MDDLFAEIASWGHRYYLELGLTAVFFVLIHFLGYPFIMRRSRALGSVNPQSTTAPGKPALESFDGTPPPARPAPAQGAARHHSAAVQGTGPLDQRPAIWQSAPNGIAIGGNNYGNAEVHNNYERPEPAKRIIADADLAKASSILRPAAPGIPITLRVVGMSREVQDFANAVYSLFTSAGWKVKVMRSAEAKIVYQGANGRGYQSDGTGFSCSNYSLLNPGAITVLQAIRATGLPCTELHEAEEDDPQFSPKGITVLIGSRFTRPHDE